MQQELEPAQATIATQVQQITRLQTELESHSVQELVAETEQLRVSLRAKKR